MSWNQKCKEKFIQVGTIPWLLLGELCPSKTKGISSGVTVFIAFISIFAVVKLFPLSLEMLKPPATYGIFALIRFFNFYHLGNSGACVNIHTCLFTVHRILFTISEYFSSSLFFPAF